MGWESLSRLEALPADPAAPVLHDPDGHNVAWDGTYDYGDIDWALENADHVVKIDRLHYVCDCVDCRSEAGSERTMQLVVSPLVWRPLSLN